MPFGGSQALRIGEPVLEYGRDSVPDDGGTRPPQTKTLNEGVALPLTGEDEAVPLVPRVLMCQILNGQLIVSVTRPNIDGNAWTDDSTQEGRVGCQGDRGIEAGLARSDQTALLLPASAIHAHPHAGLAGMVQKTDFVTKLRQSDGQVAGGRMHAAERLPIGSFHIVIPRHAIRNAESHSRLSPPHRTAVPIRKPFLLNWC
jgi:hypothetical protein